MAMTEADRQWVKDMIEAASEHTMREVADMVYGEHPKACPNVRNLKMLAVGIGIGVVISSGASVAAVLHVIKVL